MPRPITTNPIKFSSATRTLEMPRTRHIDIVFDAPPGPELAGFVEIELDTGRSIMLGRWLKRADGYHVIRITREDAAHWLLADSEAVRLGIIP